MKNTKYILAALAVLFMIGGGAVYWSKIQKADYAIEASAVISESLGDRKSIEEQTQSDPYAQTNEKTTKPIEARISSDPQSMVQQASAGAVDLAVQFYNPEKNIDDYWIFRVAMDTHSVDLDQIDLKQSVYFIDGHGETIEEGFEVKKSGAGHHVSQYIELPKQIDGAATITEEFESFKMVFKNIDGVERIELEWDMTIYPELFEDSVAKQ